MEDLTIPGWALLAFGIVIVPWLIWLTHKTNQNDKDIAINTTNDTQMNHELVRLNESIDNRLDTISSRVEKLDDKISQILVQNNLFLAQETNFLKQLIPKATS